MPAITNQFSFILPLAREHSVAMLQEIVLSSTLENINFKDLQAQQCRNLTSFRQEDLMLVTALRFRSV